MEKTEVAPAALARARYWTAAILLVAGGAIAAMASFDLVFDMLTRGVAWLRVLVYALVLAAGLWFAQQAGLSVLAHGLAHPVAAPVAIGLAVALAIVVVDGFIFRAILPHGYVTAFTETGAGKRLAYYLLRAFNEEVFYRLFLMSALVCVPGLVWRGGAPPDIVYWIAIVGAQTLAIAVNAWPADASPGIVLHALLRFNGPGILWGYLYWRHGFITAQAAHVATHLFLQPVISHVL